MLAYAGNRPAAGKRESSPNILLVVISVHVALLAVAMSTKMDFTNRVPRTPPLIDVRLPTPPPPNHPQPKQPQPKPQNEWVDHPTPTVPVPQPAQPVDTGGTTTDPIVLGGAGTAIIPEIPQTTSTTPIHHDPQLLTPASELKPPYPASKLASEEEATLRLRLTIDDRGQVIAVDPVGTADRAFLESARRYIIAHWRYQPASDNGRAMASTINVTLQFRLDG